MIKTASVQAARIRISYGRGDAAEFAANLDTWLDSEGYEPWLDVEKEPNTGAGSR